MPSGYFKGRDVVQHLHCVAVESTGGGRVGRDCQTARHRPYSDQEACRLQRIVILTSFQHKLHSFGSQGTEPLKPLVLHMPL